MTYDEIMREAVACESEAQAEELIERAVSMWSASGPMRSRDRVRRIVLDNIGYYTGYLDREDAARILKLFHTEHPFFGPIENWPKTAAEAMQLGIKAGERAQAAAKGEVSFTCPVCNMTSHNPHDVMHGYCGNCCAFTGIIASRESPTH